MRNPDELARRFREEGRKVTPQRLGVFRALYGNMGHPTAEAVHARVIDEMPAVSLRTVYATLHELAALGEIVELDLGTGSVRFDPNMGSHHHLVCDGCAAVFDVETELPPVHLPDSLDHGFEVSGTQIVFRGRCPRCRSVKDAPPGLVPVPLPPDTPVSAGPHHHERGEHAHG